MKASARTDKGRTRSENEDAALLFIPGEKELLERKGALAVVADGVGGNPGGKVASHLAVHAVKEAYYRNPKADTAASLRDAVLAANVRICSEAKSNITYQKMSTTCTAMVVRGLEAHICHVGDSRAYLFGRDQVKQITKDHSLVARLVAEGEVSEADAPTHPLSHVIVRALGMENVEPENYCVRADAGDILLLCTDGLYKLLPEKEICNIVTNLPVPEACESLVQRANDNGGSDNISVVVVSLGDLHRPAAAATRPFVVGGKSRSPILLAILAFVLCLLCLLYLYAIR